MKDIEDFIKVKSALGKNDYNNVDTAKYDLEKCKQIFKNLLLWLQENDCLNTTDNSNFSKLFEAKLNKEIRQSRIKDLKKSVLLNIFNNLLTKDDFECNLHKYFDNLKLLLRKKPMRNISGITSVTVILHP